MTIINKNNKIYWYIIILFSLFILVLFTRNQISSLQINLDEKQTLENELENKRQELQVLNDIKVKVESEWNKIEKYLSKINEDEIIDYIYSKIEEDNLKYTDWVSIVRNLTITKGEINEIWFYESNISLSLRVPTEDRMFKILDFFVKEDSKYKFFIDSFSYPKISSDSSYNITIPLKVFYK